MVLRSTQLLFQHPLLQSQYPNLLFPANLNNEVYSTEYPNPKNLVTASNSSYLRHKIDGGSSIAHIKASGSGSCCPDISNESVAFEPQLHETNDSPSGPASSIVSPISTHITP